MATKKAVCIEIGLFVTRVCFMDYGHKQNRVRKIFSFETPENTVEDAYILDKETFAGALKRELKKNKISCKDFVFSISSNKILSREVVIPVMKEKLIPRVIESEKKEYFPMDISEHLLTYTILETKKETNELRLMVYAAPANLITNYQNLAKTLGCNIVALDYMGNSIYQWMKREPENSINYFLLINEQSSMLSILDNGYLALQRNMNFGVEALLEVLIQTRSEAQLSLPLAYQKIIQRDYNEFEKEKIDDSIKSLAGNVSRVLEFFITKNKNANIDKIKVMGKGARIDRVIEILQDELGIEVERVDEIPRVKLKNKKCEGEYVTCIGASYPSVNFLDALVELKEKETISVAFMVVVLVLTMIGCAAIIYSSYMNYQDEVKKRNKLTEQVASFDDIVVIHDTYESTMTFFEEIKEMHLSTYNPNEGLRTLIEELENKLPSAVMIKSFSSSKQGISMSFVCQSKEEAAKTLMQLRTIESFSNITSGGVIENIDITTGKKEVAFSVSCEYANLVSEESIGETDGE